MRSTRQKLKLLRGISRASANGGNGLTPRKSSSANNQQQHHNHHSHNYNHNPATGNGSAASTTTASTNGSVISSGEHNHQNFHQHNKLQQQNHSQQHSHHQSNALTQHNNQFYSNGVSSQNSHPQNHHTSVSGGGRHPHHNNHPRYNNHHFHAKSHSAAAATTTNPTAARAGAIRAAHTTTAAFSQFGAHSAHQQQQQQAPASASSASRPVDSEVESRENVGVPENSGVAQGHADRATVATAAAADPHSSLISTVTTSTIGIGHPHRQWTQFLATNMDCTGLNSDIREKAFGICRDYLHGAWKQIDSKDLIIKRVSGGLSNWLYHCSLPLSLTPQHNEPTQVLLRFYGQVHGEGALESLITESVIFTLLSERKLGPRLYGVFPGGRVEEFIPARPLLTVELRDPELSLLIAQKTAQIHGLNIPISKEPSWLWGTMDRWMANVRDCFKKPVGSSDCKPEILQKLIDCNLEGELEWLKEFLPKVNSPVVFAHNDLQEGNILIRPEYETPDDKLALIDFEYCSYNYRGFDLANHFCEWSYNYNVENYPNFKFTPEDLPNLEEKLRFIRRYVQVLREEYRMNFTDADDEFLQTSALFNEEHIIREVEAFTLASHFFWSLWAIVNAQVSKIPFGYWEYGLCRLETYFILKKTLV